MLSAVALKQDSDETTVAADGAVQVTALAQDQQDVLTAAALALRTPLATLASSYGSHFTLSGFEPPVAFAVIAGAVLLGWSGAGIVTGHYLRQTRPTET